MTTVELEPQPRIDGLVRVAPGEERRRTEYVGVAWFDGKPVASGLAITPGPQRPRGTRVPSLEAAFFLPDSLPYVRDRLAEATLTVGVGLRAAGEIGAILHADAYFVDDPSGTPTWVQLRVVGHLGWPAAVEYRVVATTALDAVR